MYEKNLNVQRFLQPLLNISKTYQPWLLLYVYPGSSVASAGGPKPPSFMRGSTVSRNNDESGEASARYILSGADGRGGRRTILRAASASTGMTPWVRLTSCFYVQFFSL